MYTINKLLIFMILGFGYLNTAYVFASEIHNQPNHYQIDQIMTAGEGVFLLVNGRWIGSEGLLAMPESFLLLENGKWVSIEDVVNCDTYKTWVCRICGYVNPQGVTRCLNSDNHPK